MAKNSNSPAEATPETELLPEVDTRLATEAEAKKAYEDFLKGDLKEGLSIRFVTRGGETVPVVTKRA